jgi:antitoxin component YwqK of YwqJK toxin-antitoxin module
MLRYFFSLASAFSLLLLLSCTTSNVPTPDPTTNPANCRLSKLLYDSNTSTSYDAYTYNPDGTVAKIENYGGGSVVGATSFSYANGLLIRQQTQGEGGIVYTYNGSSLTNAQLLSRTGSTAGNLAIALDAAQRISTITFKNLTSGFAAFEGMVTTLTYDALGNCTQLEAKLPNGFVAQRTTYTNFDKARAHYNTLNGLIFEPDFATNDYFTYAPIWKSGPSAPNQIMVSSFSDKGGPAVVTTATFTRTANQSGLTTSLKNALGTTSFFQYTGCQ